MDQKIYSEICRISDQTRTLFEQMLTELEIGDELKETYRECILLAIFREKNAAALAMMEYLTNKNT